MLMIRTIRVSGTAANKTQDGIHEPLCTSSPCAQANAQTKKRIRVVETLCARFISLAHSTVPMNDDNIPRKNVAHT
jgi:hypothetical protein